NKNFDGGQSTAEEKELREFYKRLLNFTINSPALMGEYRDLHSLNRENSTNYSNKVLTYARWSDEERLIIVSNFDAEEVQEFELTVPDDLIKTFDLKDGSYVLKDQLFNDYSTQLMVEQGTGKMQVKLEPLQSFILKLN